MFDRLWARIGTEIRTYFARSITIGGLVAFILTVLCLAIATLWPAMRATGSNWGNISAWKAAFLAGLPALVAAMYLKLSERYRRTFLWAKDQRGRRRSRKLIAGCALRQLCPKVKAKLEVKEAEHIRQQLLHAAALSVASIMPGNQIITANFIVFCNDDHSKMEVTARSTQERLTGNRYKREEMAAWMAINQSDVVVIDDVITDDRCNHMTNQNKKYRTIAAVPITIGNRAFGAISLDASIPYLFHGKASDVALQLEPYIVLLSMTLDGSEPSEECKYEPGHH